MHKAKDQATGAPLKNGDELLHHMWHPSYYSCYMSHEWGKEQIVITTNGTLIDWMHLSSIYK